MEPFFANQAATGFTPAIIWQGWHFDPSVVAGILLLLVGYLCGLHKLWQRGSGIRTLPRWRLMAFLTGIAALIIALLSPLDTLSAQLLSAHMSQHLLLLIVAPIALILGRTLLVIRWGLPLTLRRRWQTRWRQLPLAKPGRRFATSPLIAILLNSAALWLWHMPRLYEASLRNTPVHIAEHISFLVTAYLLWWVILFPQGGRSHYGISIALVFVTALQGALLGALLTFSNVLWYPINSPAAYFWGMTPLEDQQLAGLLMWIPSGFIYLGAIALLFAAWLAAIEEGMRRRRRSPLERREMARRLQAQGVIEQAPSLQTDGGYQS